MSNENFIYLFLSVYGKLFLLTFGNTKTREVIYNACKHEQKDLGLKEANQICSLLLRSKERLSLMNLVMNLVTTTAIKVKT